MFQKRFCPGLPDGSFSCVFVVSQDGHGVVAPQSSTTRQKEKDPTSPPHSAAPDKIFLKFPRFRGAPRGRTVSYGSSSPRPALRPSTQTDENRKSETVYNHRKNLSTLRPPAPPGQCELSFCGGGALYLLPHLTPSARDCIGEKIVKESTTPSSLPRILAHKGMSRSG